MRHMKSRSLECKLSGSGVGIAALCLLAGTPIAAAQVSLGIELLDTLPGNGNDCWGYVSASGREYALVGNRDRTKFVEITDPNNIVLVDEFLHNSSLWSDIRTYGNFAYVVTEAGGGIQIFDLSDIDSGNITLVRTMNSPSSSHNVVVNTDSGFMYMAGGAIFDLSDPGNPVRVASGSGWHDAQVVTYTSGQYAGREIMFAFKPGAGMDIIDVTDKSSLFRISLSVYPGLSITHQGWTEDMQYMYVDDESSPTRTIVFDISDLSNPVHVNTFTNGLGSTNHNLFVKDGFIFEANYTSGLRVFDACDPVNPVEVGFYDTFPASNSSGFSGAWGVYPFFPSGVCIINNISGDFYVVDPSEAVSKPCRGGCPCACDFDTGQFVVCDIFDFLAFQSGFVAGERCACNMDVSTGVNVCDLFDFLAFQNEFVGGCP